MTVNLDALADRLAADPSIKHTEGGPATDVAVMGLAALRRTPGWAEAMHSLRVQWQQHGAAARERARSKRGEFRGRRGTMVLDVVLSRQRRYDTHVQPCIRRWERAVAERGGLPTLRWLVDHADLVATPALPLRPGEAATILGVAHALLRYGADAGLAPADEDRACESWAATVAGLEFAPRLDPYVGAVSGIGAALFAYTRMGGLPGRHPAVRRLPARGAQSRTAITPCESRTSTSPSPTWPSPRSGLSTSLAGARPASTSSARSSCRCGPMSMSWSWSSDRTSTRRS